MGTIDMTDTAARVYEGNGWQTPRASIAQALTTLDRIEEAAALSSAADAEAAEAQVALVADLGRQLKQDLNQVTADIGALVMEVTGDNAVLIEGRQGAEHLIALEETQGESAARLADARATAQRLKQTVLTMDV